MKQAFNLIVGLEIENVILAFVLLSDVTRQGFREAIEDRKYSVALVNAIVSVYCRQASYECVP